MKTKSNERIASQTQSHLDRIKELEDRLAVIDTGCFNCGGLPHTEDCRVRDVKALVQEIASLKSKLEAAEKLIVNLQSALGETESAWAKNEVQLDRVDKGLCPYQPPCADETCGTCVKNKMLAEAREAFAWIVEQWDPHRDDETDNDLDQDPDYFCDRCIAVRFLADSPTPNKPEVSGTVQPDAAVSNATHRCVVCSALWCLWPPTWPGHCGDKGCQGCLHSNWSLVSPQCGPCCNNAPMGAQIQPLDEICRAWAEVDTQLDRLRSENEKLKKQIEQSNERDRKADQDRGTLESLLKLLREKAVIK